MTDALPEGHPLPWSELVEYEQQQGGYWLYGPHCDVYGNGKIWVRVPRLQGVEGAPDYAYTCPECQWRTKDTRYEGHVCPGDQEDSDQ